MDKLTICAGIPGSSQRMARTAFITKLCQLRRSGKRQENVAGFYPICSVRKHWTQRPLLYLIHQALDWRIVPLYQLALRRLLNPGFTFGLLGFAPAKTYDPSLYFFFSATPNKSYPLLL